MNAQQILDATRTLLDDTVEKYRHTDAELLGYLANADDEACLRLRVMQDASSAVCSIALTTSAQTYTLHPSIYAVRRARIDGQRDALKLTDVRWLDRNYPGWDDATLTSAALPVAAVFDAATRKLTLNTIPAAAGTLKLMVWRRPTDSEKVEGLDDDPNCPEHAHQYLKHWIAHEALAQKDAEKGDAAESQKQLGYFTAALGPRPTLHDVQLWSVQRERKIIPHFT